MELFPSPKSQKYWAAPLNGEDKLTNSGPQVWVITLFVIGSTRGPVIKLSGLSSITIGGGVGIGLLFASQLKITGIFWVTKHPDEDNAW